MRFWKLGWVAAIGCLGLLTGFGDANAQAANAGDKLKAFENFVGDGNFANANFYIENRLIDTEMLDTSQIFYDLFMQKYSSDIVKHAADINALYNYLNKVKPIDLNKRMACGNSTGQFCLLVNTLFAGAPRQAIDYFVARGLDLNQQREGLAAATLPLLLRLGTVYSVSDLNHFVAEGMVLGDETYPINDLANYYEDRVLSGYSGTRLDLPDNFLSLHDQNLLDVLVIALGTGLRYDNAAQQSAHRKVLCDFIAYAAPSFTPSFDYLSYVLAKVEDFRADKIGKQERSNRRVYQPFPDSCVNLVRGMVASHQQIDSVISRFAGAGDVKTATWLLSIRDQGHVIAGAAKPEAKK